MLPNTEEHCNNKSNQLRALNIELISEDGEQPKQSWENPWFTLMFYSVCCTYWTIVIKRLSYLRVTSALAVLHGAIIRLVEARIAGTTFHPR